MAPTRTSHWLLYGHDGRVLAYDLATFPASQGVVLAQSGGFYPAGAWSPDGSKVLYSDGANYHVRNMSTRTPGEPLNLGTADTALWSGDSRSLSFYTSAGLTTVGVTQAAPIQRPVATGPSLHEWSPAGNWLAYANPTAVSVARVVDGVPEPSIPLIADQRQFAWSPTGTHLAAWRQGELSVVDLRGAAPVVTDVTTPTSPSPLIREVRFSSDGSRLAFLGNLARTQEDLYVVNVLAPAEAVVANLPLPSTTGVATYIWATGYPLLAYFSYSGNAFVDASGATPSATSFTGNMGVDAWVPNSKKLLGLNTASEIVSLDATQPAAAPLVLTEPGPFIYSMGGPTSAIAYCRVGSSTIKLDDLLGTGTPPTIVVFPVDIGSNPGFKWSRDASFIAVSSVYTPSNPDTYRLHLFRVEGTSASSAIELHTGSQRSTPLAWQP